MKIRSARDVGAVARQRRRELALSQNEVALRAGVTRQWLVRFEQGNTDVTLSKAFAVWRVLGVELRARPEGAPENALAAPGASQPTYVAETALVATYAADTIRGRPIDDSLSELRAALSHTPAVPSRASEVDG